DGQSVTNVFADVGRFIIEHFSEDRFIAGSVREADSAALALHLAAMLMDSHMVSKMRHRKGRTPSSAVWCPPFGVFASRLIGRLRPSSHQAVASPKRSYCGGAVCGVITTSLLWPLLKRKPKAELRR